MRSPNTYDLALIDCNTTLTVAAPPTMLTRHILVAILENKDTSLVDLNCELTNIRSRLCSNPRLFATDDGTVHIYHSLVFDDMGYLRS